jgi:hypothetical protein
MIKGGRNVEGNRSRTGKNKPSKFLSDGEPAKKKSAAAKPKAKVKAKAKPMAKKPAAKSKSKSKSAKRK